MASWVQVVEKEHSSIKKHKVWKAVLKEKVLMNTKNLTLTWAMKPKLNRVKRSRLTAHGFEQ
eukprot:4158350-Ditylum_brightwellii.AAC.1